MKKKKYRYQVETYKYLLSTPKFLDALFTFFKLMRKGYTCTLIAFRIKEEL